MNLKINEIKTCTCGYLYTDGHVVLLHEKLDSDAGKVKWATVYESIGLQCNLFEAGRIVFYNNDFLPLLCKLKAITVDKPSIKSGTRATLDRKIICHNIRMDTGVGHGWTITNMPGICINDIEFVAQDEIFNPDPQYWCDYKIKKIYKVTEKLLKAA